MKNKIRSASICMAILSLAGLLFLAVCAEKKNYQDLILVVSDGSGLPAFDLKEINRICNEELAVTYDINKRVTAKAANSTRPVTLIGTNNSYVDVINLQIVTGSFWTEEAWTMGSRYVILNEPAAFQLFGSNNIIGNTVKFDGEIWMIAGVVRDGNKKKIMGYVPASAITGHPEALMAKTQGGTAAVLNSLRRLGVYESNCKAVDVAAVARLFWQQFIVSVSLVIMLLTIMFSSKKVLALKEACGVLKLRYQIMYLDEVVAKSRRELGWMAFQSLQMILSIMAGLFVARQILTIVLRWKDTGSQIKYLTDYFFQGKMQWLMRYFISGPILFSGFVIALIMVIVSVVKFGQGTGSYKAS